MTELILFLLFVVGERMLDHEYDDKRQAVIIRKPGVNINEDFIVTARD